MYFILILIARIILIYLAIYALFFVLLPIFSFRKKNFLKTISQNKPKVAVIIPSYNEEETIIDCLNSLKEQTYKNFEALVVLGSRQRFLFLSAEKLILQKNKPSKDKGRRIVYQQQFQTLGSGRRKRQE